VTGVLVEDLKRREPTNKRVVALAVVPRAKSGTDSTGTSTGAKSPTHENFMPAHEPVSPRLPTRRPEGALASAASENK
jgi:hypothetical protein